MLMGSGLECATDEQGMLWHEKPRKLGQADLSVNPYQDVIDPDFLGLQCLPPPMYSLRALQCFQ